jgi:hypothetical protein
VVCVDAVLCRYCGFFCAPLPPYIAVASPIDYLMAWREIARQKAEKRKKDALYRVLVRSDLNYMIIKDLVNAARNDVVIDITTRDGARIEIKPIHPLEVEKPPRSEDY